MEFSGHADSVGDLTPRQREVLSLLLKGLSEKEVAGDLHLSRHTVHNHVKAIYRAMEVSSRVELIRRCSGLDSADGGIRPNSADHAGNLDILLKHAADIVFQVDRQGTIQYINSTVTGDPTERYIGRNVLEFVLPEHHDQHRAAISRVFETAELQECSVTVRGEDGVTRRYESRFSPVWKDGRIDAVVVVARERGPAA